MRLVLPTPRLSSAVIPNALEATARLVAHVLVAAETAVPSILTFAAMGLPSVPNVATPIPTRPILADGPTARVGASLVEVAATRMVLAVS